MVAQPIQRAEAERPTDMDKAQPRRWLQARKGSGDLVDCLIRNRQEHDAE
jgi:hypothetical protein